MKISPHFTLEEMEFSQLAVSLQIPNHANETQCLNLKALCQNVLEPLREKIGGPVFVTSGFRSEKINKMVGGSPNSQHKRGEAADIHVSGMSTQELFEFIIKSGIVLDQIIQEFNTWVHVSYKRNGKNRRSILRATHSLKGAVIYNKVNEGGIL